MDPTPLQRLLQNTAETEPGLARVVTPDKVVQPRVTSKELRPVAIR
jgi:hypothetical protein